MSDLTPEDTNAMRKQGDWRAYLNDEIAKGNARREQPAKKPAPPAPPGRRPGAWPPGTSPPAPPPPIPADEIQRALAEYRQWLDQGQPPGHYRCECTSCLQLEGENR